LPFPLNNLEVSVNDGKLATHILFELKTLLSCNLLDNLELLIVIQYSHFILLLCSLVFVHGTILSFLVKGLRNILRQANVLKDNASELKALVFKHLVKEVNDFSSLFLALDLIDFKISLSSSEYTNTLSDSGLDLLVELIDTDIVDELLNRLVVFLATEDSANLDFDEDVIVGGAALHVKLVDHVLLSNKVLNLSLFKRLMEVSYPRKAHVDST